VEKLTQTSQTITATTWDLRILDKGPKGARPLSFLRDLMQIKSQNLVVDFEPILDQLLWPESTYQPHAWDLVGAGAQAAIDATMTSLLEAYQDFEMSNEDALRDLSPRASTKTTFNVASTLGFFQTLIYLPLPSVGGQPFWNLTMIMDIRSLETPKARKTGIWGFANVGTTQDEHLAYAYNEGKRLLAYSVCLEYMDRSKEIRRWFISRLCLVYLGPQEYYDIDVDPRGTFIESAMYDLGEFLHVESYFIDISN
jgi:hypothetical protein